MACGAPVRWWKYTTLGNSMLTKRYNIHVKLKILVSQILGRVEQKRKLTKTGAYKMKHMMAHLAYTAVNFVLVGNRCIHWQLM